MKTVAFHNLGCKTNSYEMDVMQEIVRKAGFDIVDFEQKADAYIVNTCTVTNIADRKSRQMLHRAKQRNPQAIVIAVGCYVQTGRETLEQDQAVDLLVGNNHKSQIAEILIANLKEKGLWTAEDEVADIDQDYVGDINEPCDYEDMMLTKTAEHTRAYIKIQDGCNQFCSYCLIPFARGRVRSRRMGEILREVEGLVAAGYREIVLTGIHISSYGVDFDDEAWKLGISKTLYKESAKAAADDQSKWIQDYSGQSKLIDLLEKICAIPGLDRVRLGSLEPRIVTEENGKRMGQLKNLCPHFHLSLQSGCDATLKRMNRHYSAAEYKASVEILRKYFEHPAITTDVIVGFPGETEEEFASSYTFLQDISFYETHVFKYSKREGTVAEKMPNQVAEPVKTQRSDVLLALTEDNSKAYRAYYVDKMVEVLFEELWEHDGRTYLIGHTMHYVKVAVSIQDNGLKKEYVEGSLGMVTVSGFLTDEVLLGIPVAE